jgi:hypothetical protein
MSCCKATKSRDVKYDNGFETKSKAPKSKVSKWVVFIILCLISPFFIPLIIYILYKGIVKNEALDFKNLIKLIKQNNKSQFDDYEVVK